MLYSRRRKPIQLLDDPLDAIKKQLKSREHKERDIYDYKKKPKKEHKEEKGSSIEELRKKRKEREREERHRMDQLFVRPQNVTLDERDMAYNSQFNKQETNQAHKRRRF